ncbi:MAG TPA: ABC transporter substrate-binding protein [Stellaceae bacterium]|nr:ABC transporter substrate-binding protein [Stellaceae bacterium]
MTKRRRIVHGMAAAGLIAAVCGLGGVAARAEMEHTIVSLPAENFGFLPFYVAQDAHFFDQQDLEVTKVVLPGVGTTNGVISGSVNFGFSNGASLTRAAARGQKLLAIALTSDKPAWQIVMRKSLAEKAHFDPKAPLAERAKAMGEARAFAIDTVNSVGHALVRVDAKIGGLDPDKMSVTPLLSQEALLAYSRGAIDGFVSNAPWTQEVLATGTAVVIADGLKGDPPWLQPFALGLVIVRPEFCIEHRSICMKMGHALVAAVKFVHEHKAESLAILEKRFPKVDRAVMQPAFDMVEKSMSPMPIITEAAIANADRLNIEAGFMKPQEKLRAYKDLYTNEFVQ